MSRRALRIGMVCHSTFGGSGVVATELGLSLAARGHTVHFVCATPPPRLVTGAPNVFFHGVSAPDYPLFQDGQYALALASTLADLSARERLDLLHVHYAIPHATSAVLARQILGASGPRVVTTLHGTDVTSLGQSAAFRAVTRYAVLQSDALSVPSRFLQRAAREGFELPDAVAVEVIPNFVDVDHFRPAAELKVPRPPFTPSEVEGRGSPALSLAKPPSFSSGGLSGRPERPSTSLGATGATLLHNSNFRALKRVKDVVRIFARVRAALPTSRLLLVGDGPERPAVEAEVRALNLTAEVTFLGEQLDVAPLLQRSHLFLLPSDSESFGLAALEALSCGVPVVASDVGGLPDLIAPGETGFLHPVGDVEAMAASALKLLTDPALHARFSAAARARVERTWQREPVVQRYEELYLRALSKGEDGVTPE